MKRKSKKLIPALLALTLVLSLFAAMPLTASAAATETESNSCEIGGVKYSLVGALAAVPQGGTSPTVVKLLTNIDATGPTLDFNNRKITFDLNGYVLQFKQLFIRGGSMINYTGTGSFIAAWNVTNGSATSGYSSLMISDNSSCTLTGVGGTIAPEGIARLIECESGSRVTVNGDVQGSAKNGMAVIAGNGSTVTINGNITMDAAFTGIGARAYINSKVIVNGNINVPAGTGAQVSNNSTVTVEGRITAQTYASLYKSGGTFVDKTISDYAADTTKSGYRTYAEGDSTVWVKETTPPATITQQPVNSSISAGQSTSFSITASNAQSYRWQELRATGGMFAAWIDISNGGIYTGATTDTLNLTNVPVEYNNTKYRCIVKGSLGNVTSNEATLTITGVISTPIIDTQPTNRSIEAGQGTTFRVTATGALSYQWQEFRASGGPFAAWTDLSNIGIYSGATSATLSLSNVPANYNGAQYRCIVRGTSGNVTSNVVTLTVTETTTPPAITGPTNMSLTAGYAATSSAVFTVTGTPDPTVTKTSGNAAITWNNSTKKLDIAPGLTAGTYPAVLTATSGTNTATFTFTLTVTAASTGGSMDSATPSAATKIITMKINDPYMYVNGVRQEIDPGRGTVPMIISSRTLVPIRAIVEAMGGTVGWEDSTRTITLSANGHNVMMWLDKTNMIADGVNKTMDVAPVSINGRTMVPVRFAAENLGCTVDWIDAIKEVIIKY